MRPASLLCALFACAAVLLPQARPADAADAAPLLPRNSPYFGPPCAGPDASISFANTDSFAWRQPIPLAPHAYSSVVSQVAVSRDGSVLFAVVEQGNVSAWQLAPGAGAPTQLWTRDVGGCSTYATPTLTLDGGAVLVAAAHNPNNQSVPSTLHALNASTGEPLWAASAPGGYMSTPVVAPDGTIFSVIRPWGDLGGLLALDPATGSPRFPYAASFGSSGAPPALSPDGATVYVSGSLGDGKIGSGRLFAFSAATGALQGAFNATTKIMASPAVAQDGTIVVGLECA